jgi:hypothetical protein
MNSKSKFPSLTPFYPLIIAIAMSVGFVQEALATAWLINEDYKQLDARNASDFDWLVRGDIQNQITGGGKSNVTNPFASPDLTAALDAQGNTVIRFSGSNTVPKDTNTDRHFGIYGDGKKPTILTKAWSYPTVPTRVVVPVVNFSFN